MLGPYRLRYPAVLHGMHGGFFAGGHSIAFDFSASLRLSELAVARYCRGRSTRIHRIYFPSRPWSLLGPESVSNSHQPSNQSLQPTVLWRCASMSMLISVFSTVAQPRSQSGG